jgi:hypothetical protein
MRLLQSQEGAVSAIALVIITISFLALAGLLNVRIQWRIRVLEQFRLDRCVERKALLLEEIQNRIQNSNLRMFAERAAALAAAIPSAGQSLKAVKPILEAERLWQEIQLASWKIEQTQWILNRGCDRRRDLLLPLPSLKWKRPPPDPLGPSALIWEGSPNEKLRIQLWKLPNYSGAEVNEEKHKWQANWGVPRALPQ